jgi:hypothetical protein
MKSFFARVVDWPDQLTVALTAFLLYLIVQAELWLGGLIGVDLSGQFDAVAAIVAAGLAFLLHAALEKWIPEQYHGIVNAVLKWLAGIVGAFLLLKKFI